MIAILHQLLNASILATITLNLGAIIYVLRK